METLSDKRTELLKDMNIFFKKIPWDKYFPGAEGQRQIQGIFNSIINDDKEFIKQLKEEIMGYDPEEQTAAWNAASKHHCKQIDELAGDKLI